MSKNQNLMKATVSVSTFHFGGYTLPVFGCAQVGRGGIGMYLLSEYRAESFK